MKRIQVEMFQSHAGSIEADGVGGGVTGTSEFQSHAGSIEANGSDGHPHDQPGFQSHAGSIEARLPEQAVPAGEIGFNPTLVRLRPPTPTPTPQPGEVVSIPRWFD